MKEGQLLKNRLTNNYEILLCLIPNSLIGDCFWINKDNKLEELFTDIDNIYKLEPYPILQHTHELIRTYLQMRNIKIGLIPEVYKILCKNKFR